MRKTWNFHSAGQLVFGSGAVDQLGDAMRRRQIDRVLVVTDPALISAGIVERARTPLESDGVTVEVFDGGEPEPSLDAATQANPHTCLRASLDEMTDIVMEALQAERDRAAAWAGRLACLSQGVPPN